MQGFSPDAPSNTPGIVTDCQNWIPYEAGMEAAASLVDAGASALAATCTGAGTFSKLDDTRRTIAGTGTQLYELSGTAWTLRSASTYTANSVWSFCQFGDATIFSNYNDSMQRSTSGAFAAITGPRAKIVESVVSGGGGQVFAFNTVDGTYGTSPDRWWCSAMNDETSWTVSTATQCTTGRLIGPGGSIVAAKKFGADSIVAYKNNSMFHGRYVGGADVWVWQEIPDVGAAGLRCVANLGFSHFIVAQDGFYLYDGARPVQIGLGKVRAWFARNVASQYVSLIEVVYEKDRNRVWVFFPYSGSTTLDKALVYHVATGEWGLVDIDIQTALQYIGSGVTYDTISGSFDSLTESMDSPYWSAASRYLAVFDTSNDLQTISGTPGSSYFAGADTGDDAKASRLDEAYVRYATRPTTASCTVYGSFALGGTEVTSSTVTAYDEVGSSNTPGRFTLRSHARWHRAQFNFTGPCQVTDYGARIRPTGGR